MNYIPLNYGQLSVLQGSTNPSQVKSYNNKTFAFWQRALFQRACSVLNFELPEEWGGSIKDFWYYCLFRFGYVGIFSTPQNGLIFQPGNLSGYDIWYQPTTFKIANPALKNPKDLTINKDCALCKLTPDYMGTFDIIDYYAEKLSTLDGAINMSIINNKFAYILGARNKAAAEALKKIFDKVNKGEPTVIFDTKLLNDPQDKDIPFQFLERGSLKNGYITSDQLMDFQTLLNMFDTEIGIPSVPYQKKERMVTDEANSKQIDSTSRSTVWLETCQESLKKVNEMFNTNITVELRYDVELDPDTPEVGGENNGNTDDPRT